MDNADFFDDAKAADLDLAIVVGTGSDGRLQLFLNTVDREGLIVLLERAKLKLIRSLEPI